MTVTTKSDQSHGDDEGYLLVGKFLQKFALTEQSLDAGIGKLLGLNHSVKDIVGWAVPFVKKIEVFFSAENVLAELPDKARGGLLKEVRSAILSLNDERVMFAHCPFSYSASEGLTFRKVAVRGKLSVESKTRSVAAVNENCHKATQIAEQLDQIVAEMTPYVPKMDFRDPRNAHLIVLL